MRNPIPRVRAFELALAAGSLFLAVAVIAIVAAFVQGRLNVDDTETLASALQKIAITIAVVGGGVWTLFTFRTLQIRDRARAELAALEAQMEKQAVLDVTVSASPFAFPGHASTFLDVTVSIRNAGSRNTTIDGRPELLVSELVPAGSTVVPIFYNSVPPVINHLDPPLQGQAGDSESEDPEENDSVVRAGMTSAVHYLVRLPGPGAYHLFWNTNLHPQEVAVMRALGLRVLKGSVWLGETIVSVPPEPRKAAIGAPLEKGIRMADTVAWCESALVTASSQLYRRVDEAEPDWISAVWTFICEVADLRRFVLFNNPTTAQCRVFTAAGLGEMQSVCSDLGVSLQALEQALMQDDHGMDKPIRAAGLPHNEDAKL